MPTPAKPSPLGASSQLAPALPPTRLTAVRVRDFRGIEDCTIGFSDTTVILGENNVGKSALLEALDIALGDRFAATTDLRVMHDGVVTSCFAIDLELSPWAGTTFDPSVTDLLGALYRLEPGTGRQRYFIRVTGEPDETQRVIRLKRGFVNDWNSGVSEAMVEDLDPAQRRSLWFSLVDAQRDMANDLRARGSPWGKMLRRLQLDETIRKGLEKQLADLSTQMTNALPDAAKLATAIGRVQSVLAGQVAQARLAMLPKALSDLWRTADLLVQATGHPELSIGQQGMGARSLASMLAFRAWLESEISLVLEAPLMIVTAFEEPEAHLHPQAQRAVFAEIAGVSGQRIISTHSPFVASVAQLDDFRVIRRAGGVTVRSADGISNDSTLAPKNLANVRRFCVQRNGDMLFARLVILGEGDTEAGVLPELAHVWWGCTPEERGVSIVPVDGAGNGRTFATFVERLGIPWLLLLDGDAQGIREQGYVSKVPTLAPLAPSRVVVIRDGGAGMDLEELLATHGRMACLRAISAHDSVAARGLGNASASQVAKELRARKAVLSRLLGQELAKDWTTRASMPTALQALFSAADGLLA